MNKVFDIEVEKNRLASLQQDFEILHETLGVSGPRRVNANMVDVVITALIGLLLQDQNISPWWSLTYFLVRDFPPPGRSIGKILAGISIFSADTLAPASSRQLVLRGIANLCIVLPLCLLFGTVFAYLAAAAFVSGIVFFLKGGDPDILRFFGYDGETGRTLADRIAGTHLIRERDVRSLALMDKQIQNLRETIEASERR